MLCVLAVICVYYIIPANAPLLRVLYARVLVRARTYVIARHPSRLLADRILRRSVAGAFTLYSRLPRHSTSCVRHLSVTHTAR